jgi:hypothetical protein
MRRYVERAPRNIVGICRAIAVNAEREEQREFVTPACATRLDSRTAAASDRTVIVRAGHATA